MSPALPTKLVFIDLETTGTNPEYDQIIEIGLVRIEDGREVTRYQTLIDPGTYVSPFIEQYTGITTAMLADAPTFATVAEEIWDLLDDCVFVAHNARFDFGFLRAAFKRQGRAFAPRQLCTVKLTRKLYPGLPRHNLDTIIANFGLTCTNRHRALDDAAVLWDLYQRILIDHPADRIAACIDGLTKRPKLPGALTPDDLKRLPTGPGVYIFRGSKDYPLYVGKSINLRERVTSHFTNDMQTQRHLHMVQQIERIETIETAGEVGALLTESLLVKDLQPLYNRVLRRKQEMVLATRTELPNGYLSIQLERVNQIDPEASPFVVGLYPSYKRAKDQLGATAKQYELCPKLLELEASGGRCFQSQLGQCRGACTGDEEPVRYNLRFAEAFGRPAIHKWPFPGPIVFTEAERDETAEAFIIDRWCLLHRIRYEHDAEGLEPVPYSFDFDTYKILSRFLLDPKQQANIRLLPPALAMKS